MNTRKKLMVTTLVLTGLMLAGCNPIEAHMDMIGLDAAKEVALKDAGIEDERVVFTESQLDTKKNTKYYDIDFIADGAKYEYDIDALTGVVIEAEKPEMKVEEESTYTQEEMEERVEEYWEMIKEVEEKTKEIEEKMAALGEQRSYEITEDLAKEIALNQVPGATVNDIYEFEVDVEIGKIVYEGKIIYDNMEYDFEIDGYSGAIREWDAESIYD